MSALASPSGVNFGARDAGVAYWSARAVAYAAIVAVTVMSLPDDPSLALARWSGAGIVRGGFSHAGLGWLGAISAWAFAPGGTAVSLGLAAVAALVAFACTEQRARLRGGRILGVAAVVVAAVCSLSALHAGGGALSAAFAAALALELAPQRAGDGARRPIVAAALTAVWCNASPDGVIAPLIALTFLIGTVFGRSAPEARRSAWYAAGASALATLATPAFAAFPGRAFEALRVDRSLGDIVALHPAEIAPLAYGIGFTFVVLAFLALGSGARVRAGDASLIVLATLLALANGAYLAIFGVLVAPLLAGSAFETFTRREAHDAMYRTRDFVFVCAALAFAGLLAIFAAPRAEAALSVQPYALAKAAFARGSPHRFFCANVDWCDYVLANGPPGTSVLLDGRVVAYPAEAVEAQRTIAHAKHGWRAELDRRRVDVLLVKRGRALATLLRLRGDWRAVASDETAELFVRTMPLR